MNQLQMRSEPVDGKTDEQTEAQQAQSTYMDSPRTSTALIRGGHVNCCTSSSANVQDATEKRTCENRSSENRKSNQSDSLGRIKRPMNAFMVWSQMRRAQIASTDVKMHNSQISKELGCEWRKMSTEDKAPFINRARELREDLLRRHPDYVYRPKRKCHGIMRHFRTAPCNVNAVSSTVSDNELGPNYSANTCRLLAGPHQSSSRSKPQMQPSQDVATQMLLASLTQGQRNNMMLPAYPSNLLLLAASSMKNNTADQKKQQSSQMDTSTAISAVAAAAAAPNALSFLSLMPLLQPQYASTLTSILGSQYSPFLFGQYLQPASSFLSSVTPTVTVHK